MVHEARAVDAVQVVGIAGDEVVEHRDPGLQRDQPADQIGADEARSARHQHRFARQIVQGHYETHEYPLHSPHISVLDAVAL